MSFDKKAAEQKNRFATRGSIPTTDSPDSPAFCPKCGENDGNINSISDLRQTQMIDPKPTESAPVTHFKTNSGVNNKVTSNSETSRTNADASSIVDYENAMNRLGGDRKLFLEFVAFLCEDGPELMKKIQLAIENSDCDQLEQYSHALKGLVSNFGASECVRNALAIEKAGRTQDLDGIDKSYERLVISHQTLQHELKSFSQASE